MNAVLLIAIAAFGAFAFIASNAASASEGDDPAGEVEVNEWTRFDALFRQYGGLNGVPWEWLKAIALNESDLGRDSRVASGAVSSDGKSWGLMQLTLPTAGDYKPGVTIDDLNNAEISVDLASQYIGYLYKRYAGDAAKVIMSYNQGQGNTDKGKTYAQGYFDKWQKNLKRVEDNL